MVASTCSWSRSAGCLAVLWTVLVAREHVVDGFTVRSPPAEYCPISMSSRMRKKTFGNAAGSQLLGTTRKVSDGGGGGGGDSSNLGQLEASLASLDANGSIEELAEIANAAAAVAAAAASEENEEVEELKTRLTEVMEEMEFAQNRAEASERRVSYFKGKLEEMESSTKGLENERDGAASKVEFVTKEKNMLVDKLRQVAEELQRFKSEADNMLNLEKDRASEIESKLQGELKGARAQLKKAEQDLAKTRDEIKELNESRKGIEEQLQMTMESAKNDIYNLDRQLEEQQAERQKESDQAKLLIDKTRTEMKKRLAEAKDLSAQERKELEDKLRGELSETREKAEKDLFRLKAQHDLTLDRKNEVIGRYQSALAVLELHLNATKEKAKAEMESVKLDYEGQLRDLASKSKREKDEVMRAKEAAVKERDEKIDRLRNVNLVLTNELEETKRYYKSELDTLKTDMTRQLVDEKTRAAREKDQILSAKARIIADRDRKIAFYQDERSSIRKMAKQSVRLTRSRVRNLFRRKEKAEGDDFFQ